MDAAQAAAQGTGPVLVTIGDIVCTNTTVITPSGQAPIGGVVWSYTDMSRTTRGIPTWAVVCAVVFFLFCLLGLLFLLAKEERTEGAVQVVVQGPGFLHQVQLPVASVIQGPGLRRPRQLRPLSFGGRFGALRPSARPVSSAGRLVVADYKP
jgi:hypothetical protein